jgi:hypothetical protein
MSRCARPCACRFARPRSATPGPAQVGWAAQGPGINVRAASPPPGPEVGRKADRHATRSLRNRQCGPLPSSTWLDAIGRHAVPKPAPIGGHDAWDRWKTDTPREHANPRLLPEQPSWAQDAPLTFCRRFWVMDGHLDDLF